MKGSACNGCVYFLIDGVHLQLYVYVCLSVCVLLCISVCVCLTFSPLCRELSLFTPLSGFSVPLGFVAQWNRQVLLSFSVKTENESVHISQIDFYPALASENVFINNIKRPILLAFNSYNSYVASTARLWQRLTSRFKKNTCLALNMERKWGAPMST